MKAGAWITICGCFLAGNALAQEVQENCQLASIVQIDGVADEWPLNWTESEDKKFSYNACVDESNLYVRMKTRDEACKRKIALYGLTLWMDPNGKKKKKLGFKFPTGAEGLERVEAMRTSGAYSDAATMSASQRAELQKEVAKKLIADLELVELIGLSDDPITSTRTGITNGIRVAITSDSADTYTYEALIPLKSYRLSRTTIKKLGVGLETGKYEAPPTNSRGQQYSGGGGYQPRGTYQGANQMSRGQGYRGPRGNPQMTNPSSVWTSIQFN